MPAAPIVESNRKPRVCYVSVLYYPRAHEVAHQVESARSQAERIFLVDNTPGSNAASSPVSVDPHVTYLPQGHNLGVAAGENVGFRAAIEAGFTHVLLLDQDSTVKPGTVKGLLTAEAELLADGRSVASVGAMYLDEQTGIKAVAHRYRAFRLERITVPVGSEPIETDWLIASGSLIRTSILQEVGLMRGEMFMDVFDTEWGLRAKSMGLQCFLVPRITMGHSIGDDAVKILGRDYSVHNDARCYYMLRNATFSMRLPHMGWSWRSYAPLNIAHMFLAHTWSAKQPAKRIRLLVCAIWDGLRGSMGPMSPVA